VTEDFDGFKKAKRRKKRHDDPPRFRKSALTPYKQPATLRRPGGGRKAPTVYDPPDDQALETPDGVVWVEGRAVVSGFDAEKRKAVAKLEQAAKLLGLVVFDVPTSALPESGPIRKRWANSSVDLDDAVGEIRYLPGISFVEWTKKLYMKNIEMNEPNFEAAKARSRNALSRLIRTGRIVKRKDVEGVLRLYLPGDDPMIRKASDAAQN
jgi:hypothetical protein